ncbi:CoA transferase [Sphingomonas histidinilytica]|uniref:CaiB/BaiF CoA transferase family protein n=1 Tax=Rhizorhabdus histidinilytica TaxID=439228 RepID=UPI001AD9F6BC|nr:CaiB/BaiF CoA-transferase family protein [Rhizorhabdus histidinilytica]MBO9378869.1 CoA transferase [Rhizorhabdus histidinilytica]
MTDAAKPYEGLLVVSLEQAVAAPLASCHFAQGGARVIKIERAEGDFARKYDQAAKGSASYFVWANHGKESLCLDIKDPEDAEILHAILDRADVFIQNLAPGAAERAGFGSDSLRERNARLITCSVTGYGDHGSYRDMKAYDFLVQCESGLVAVNGAPGHPGRIGVSVCDIGAGMNAVIGIQQALIAREKSGVGSDVSVSLFDTAADWMTVPLLHSDYGRGAPKPAGLQHPSIAPYGGFATSDGETLAISIQNEREWKNLCEAVLGDPDLAQDVRFSDAASRVANRQELDAIVASYFSTRSRAELELLLRKAAIAYGAVNSVDRFSSHPQLRRSPVTLENGDELALVASPIRHSFEHADKRFGRVPKLGEHSAAIRTEFGGQSR